MSLLPMDSAQNLLPKIGCIKPVNRDFASLPPELQKEGLYQYERLKQKLSPQEFAAFEARSEFRYVLSLSDFVANVIYSYPKESLALVENGALDDPKFHLEPSAYVNSAISAEQNDPELKKNLRMLRRTHYMAIAWRDLCGMTEIDEVFLKLSNLAESIVLRTVEVVRSKFKNALGEALDKDGSPLPLIILGMGKLGGRELNFSSDLDLIFCYPYEGTTEGGSRTLEFREYFSKVVQKFSNLISDITVDSFCYRIDLRLRPFGDAGALVNSFDGLQIYYETQGRTWERYALVKARILNDDVRLGAFGQELTHMLRPFVYRRYLDYGAIQSLRKLKYLIESEVRRRALSNNFKLGKGGIREIEFIAQVFQLMRGGRYSELRDESLRKTLKNIKVLELIPEEISRALDDSYVFLRRTENVIQEFSDKQVQSLPECERDQLRLIYAMNFQNFEDYLKVLDKVMHFVHGEFLKVVASREDEKPTDLKNFDLWEADNDASELEKQLLPLLKKCEVASNLAQKILSLKGNLKRMPVGPVGRETLLELMPKVIALVARYENADVLFARVSGLIERVALRTPYLQLLRDQNEVLERFIRLLIDNQFASELITAHPILLDELFIPQYFEKPPKTDEFFAMLQERLMRIDVNDLEALMEELRLFKKIMIFRIALSDKAGKLPLMKISDCLTFLAEAIIKELILLAWDQTEHKYGKPKHRDRFNPGIAVIGYGKLGGIELGYKSDLDMVFIRETSDDYTEGEHPVLEAVFYQRLIQRILHLASTNTVGGVLYDTDMRLRPDGDTGVLISDIDAFEIYQRQRAWTWEHQALVRARPVAGSKDIIDRFLKVREDVLRSARDEEKLKEDVISMRRKMRSHLDRSSDKLYDIKEGMGGMIDVEFISQYLLLKYAPLYPDLVLWTDNVRILDECERLEIIDAKTAEDLRSAYLDIRKIYHELSLADLPRLIGVEQRIAATFRVEEIWQKIFAEKKS